MDQIEEVSSPNHDYKLIATTCSGKDGDAYGY